MTKDITSDSWEGEWAAPIDPCTILFTAIEALAAGRCVGCLFRTQRTAVCNQAAQIAQAIELPICEQRNGPSFIYVRDLSTDPRQLRVRQDGSTVQEGAQP